MKKTEHKKAALLVFAAAALTILILGGCGINTPGGEATETPGETPSAPPLTLEYVNGIIAKEGFPEINAGTPYMFYENAPAPDGTAEYDFYAQAALMFENEASVNAFKDGYIADLSEKCFEKEEDGAEAYTNAAAGLSVTFGAAAVDAGDAGGLTKGVAILFAKIKPEGDVEMMEYKAKAITAARPSEADWADCPVAEISFAPWADKYPTYCKSEARVIFASEGIGVRLTSYEADPVKKVKKDTGDVWTDSCLEFFLMPDLRTGIYFNFECNANAAMLVGRGTDRYDRKRLKFEETAKEKFDIRPTIEEESWTVEYFIPYEFIGDIYEPRCNFFKCQESVAKRKHFQCWSNIETKDPDFHRPECFGKLTVER